ncbi:MAG: hydroxyacid dehydrogenase [Planctomycetes bacterium]|nr:hydroxyacid dehydrogenase [Planctomycetota bacterium]MBI3834441.1 hydroxyacid dehydrogenase [Planctomycetota bacterium]
MKVLIVDKLPEYTVSALKNSNCEVIVRIGLKDHALADAVREVGCHVLIVRSTRVTRAVLASSPHLELVLRAGSGVDTIDMDAAAHLGIRVSNCPGMNSDAVAELVIGLMIALDRRIVDETSDLRRGVWNKKEYSKARGLKGRTMGIVGMGRIGYEVARRARAFDMNILYHDVRTNPKAEADTGARQATFSDVLSKSDFVSLHVPGGGKTEHLVGEDELSQMKPTAFLINCSRGGVVDETALARAVESGLIAGAALDVYEMEPAANDTQFQDLIRTVPHVYGTHHVGASTEQAQDAVADEVVKIIRTYAQTGRMLNCVNPMEVLSST